MTQNGFGSIIANTIKGGRAQISINFVHIGESGIMQTKIDWPRIGENVIMPDMPQTKKKFVKNGITVMLLTESIESATVRGQELIKHLTKTKFVPVCENTTLPTENDSHCISTTITNRINNISKKQLGDGE